MIRGFAIACSACFSDHGLRMMANELGWQDDSQCPQCRSHEGQKLDLRQALKLAYEFFVAGTVLKAEFGAAPLIQFNDVRAESDIVGYENVDEDRLVFEQIVGQKFFNYGPRLWMLGENYALHRLVGDEPEADFNKIVELYPSYELDTHQRFYRIRKDVSRPFDEAEYDSPPDQFCGGGRFDSSDLPVLYASPDLQTCLHEVRVSVEDEIYGALLRPSKKLRLIDLSVVVDDGENDFESIDLAMYMLFMAGENAHPALRRLAKFLHEQGFDGAVYPSFFSSLRTGSIPFETSFGISNRLFPGMQEQEQAKIMPNLAFFGRPLADGRLEIACVNRVLLRGVEYQANFGPVAQASLDEANAAAMEALEQEAIVPSDMRE